MPFNQIIDLNTSGNVGRNSYEILQMSRTLIDVVIPSGQTTVPLTAIETTTLPPGYLRPGDCIRASVSNQYVAGSFSGTFYVSIANEVISRATIDTPASEFSSGMTIGIAHIFPSQMAIPQPGEAVLQVLRSITPHTLNVNANVETLAQEVVAAISINLRLPIVVGLYADANKDGNPLIASRFRCPYYCIEVLRRAG
jgi:hypothetical protein